MRLRGKFQLDRLEGKFMGVCSGLANYTGVDATIIRVGFVVATIMGGFPWTVIAYFAAAWLGKPKRLDDYRDEGLIARRSGHEPRETMRDIDHRLAAIESYVASPNSRLAREIDELR